MCTGLPSWEASAVAETPERASGAGKLHGSQQGLEVVHVEVLRGIEGVLRPVEVVRLAVGLDVELGVVTEGHLPAGLVSDLNLGPLRHLRASAVLRNAGVV